MSRCHAALLALPALLVGSFAAGAEADAELLFAEHALKDHGTREGELYDLVVGEVERQLIREALDRNAGVKTRTAEYLGINRNTLNKKVKDFGIETAAE